MPWPQNNLWLPKEANMLKPYLDDLEDRIDPAVEDELLAGWKAFSDGAWNGDLFSPRRTQQSPPGMQWPRVPVNDALEDFDRMALQQFSGCSAALASGSGAVLNVRANYGTAILPSLFGAELFVMEAELDTLPTTRPLPGGAVAMQRLLDAGVPDLNAGYGERCFEMGRYFVDLMADYPKISRYVHIYHPDLQGPMDVCELLWGSGIFLDLVDRPDLVKSLLDLITETYTRFLDRWHTIAPPQNGYAAHWSMFHKGRIMIRDDSAMNLSPDMFETFIAPYDRQLLDRFGGGAIHFCGRGDHYIRHVGQMPGLHAVHMSQPEYNDLDTIFQHTVDRGVKLIGLGRDAAEAAIVGGRKLHGNVHCW